MTQAEYYASLQFKKDRSLNNLALGLQQEVARIGEALEFAAEGTPGIALTDRYAICERQLRICAQDAVQLAQDVARLQEQMRVVDQEMPAPGETP